MEINLSNSEDDFLRSVEEASEELSKAEAKKAEEAEATPEEPSAKSEEEAEVPEREEVSEETSEEVEEEEESEPDSDEEEKDESKDVKPDKSDGFKVFSDDKEFEIPKTATIDITTKAGKKAKVTLEELKNDFWGKQEISRQLNNFHQAKKEIQSLVDFKDDVLSSIQGMDGAYKVVELFKNLSKHDKNIAKDFEDFVNLIRVSEQNEFEKEWLEKENKGLRQKTEAQKEVQLRKQLETYEQQRMTAIRETYGLDGESLTQLTQTVRQELDSEGRLDSTPLDKAWDLVEVRAQQLSDLTRVINVLADIDPELADKDEAVYDLYAVYHRNRAMDDEMLKKKAKSLFGYEKVIKEANEKAAQEEKVTGRSKRSRKAKPERFETSNKVITDPDKEFLKDVLGG